MPTNKLKNYPILIIEDDNPLLLVLRQQIEYMGYKTDTAADGEIGLKKALNNHFSLVISDISLPKITGFSILTKLRDAKVKVPVILITNYNYEENELLAYSHGANIFHKKPINFTLLEKQIRMLLTNYDYKPIITMGDLEVDPGKKLVKKNGQTINLTKREYNLFLTLITSPGEVFTRKEIINITRMSRLEAVEGSVDTLVSRIRGKMGTYKDEDVIETVYGQGYRLSLNYLT